MSKSWYQIRAKGNAEAEIFIYDEVGLWGVSADKFVKDLAALETEQINLRINTPGGSVFEGLAIYNALVRHKAKIITHIDGLAASIGSIIALAGDEINMAQNAFYMIHNPYSLVVGEAKDMRKAAETLDKITESLIKTYAEKSGKGEDEIKQLMDAETWFTADEAKEAGFVDNVLSRKAEKAAFDLSVYSKVPKELLSYATDAPSERELERALREAGGLSRAAAKALLSKGYKGLTQREAEEGDQRDADIKNMKTQEESTMDMQEFKAKHPGIYDAIRKEGVDAGKAELDSAVATAKADAARTERERIQGVFATYRPGREEIVKALMFDGKSTRADAAEKILSAEDAKREAYKDNLKADAEDVNVPAAEPGDAQSGADASLPVDERAKAEWGKSAPLRAEFGNHYDAWLAYKINAEAGNARILGAKGGN